MPAVVSRRSYFRAVIANMSRQPQEKCYDDAKKSSFRRNSGQRVLVRARVAQSQWSDLKKCQQHIPVARPSQRQIMAISSIVLESDHGRSSYTCHSADTARITRQPGGTGSSRTTHVPAFSFTVAIAGQPVVFAQQQNYEARAVWGCAVVPPHILMDCIRLLCAAHATSGYYLAVKFYGS